jgi:hypothetical protein
MNSDIGPLLNAWDFNPGEVIVRRVKGKDGMEKIQLRVDLGILQMNAQGRPDGKLPMGHATWLEFYQQKAAQVTDEPFQLKPEDFAKFQQELIQFHHRYICLFHLEDFPGVLRDTERNLAVFKFVRQHCDNADLIWTLEQFKPQLLMMRGRALESERLAADDWPGAITDLEAEIENIRATYAENNRPELLENSTEMKSLEARLAFLRSKKPLNEREKLQAALDEAVRVEDYEEAARVRDRLKKLAA